AAPAPAASATAPTLLRTIFAIRVGVGASLVLRVFRRVFRALVTCFVARGFFVAIFAAATAAAAPTTPTTTLATTIVTVVFAALAFFALLDLFVVFLGDVVFDFLQDGFEAGNRGWARPAAGHTHLRAFFLAFRQDFDGHTVAIFDLGEITTLGVEQVHGRFGR